VMTDFLTRLAERTLMMSDVARPVTAPMFAPTRARAPGEASEIRDEEEADSMSGLLEIREASARDLASPSARFPRAPGDPPFDSGLDSSSTSSSASSIEVRHDAVQDAAGTSSTGESAGRNEGKISSPESRANRASAGDASGKESGAEGREDFTRRARHSDPATSRTVSESPGEAGRAPTRDLPGAVRPREIHPAEKAASAPIIKVSIGRVEVRALGRQTAPAPRARPGQPGPALTLDQYLKQRDEGKR
jgi:hypothetical protein